MLHTPVIDSVAFARAGSQCGGTLQGESFTRLVDSLVDRAGELRYEVRGLVWDDKPALELKIEGWLMVRCLRCLGAMRWPVQIQNRMRIARGDAELDLADDEGIDAIPASEALSVVELVEDELLLQWPIAPRHDVHGMQDCRAEAETVVGSGAAKVEHPFAALGRLSSQRDGTGQDSKD